MLKPDTVVNVNDNARGRSFHLCQAMHSSRALAVKSDLRGSNANSIKAGDKKSMNPRTAAPLIKHRSGRCAERDQHACDKYRVRPALHARKYHTRKSKSRCSLGTATTRRRPREPHDPQFALAVRFEQSQR